MKWFGIIFSLCLFFQLDYLEAQKSRIESEYKLAVPDSIVNRLEGYLIDHFDGDYFVFENDSFQLSRATERFVDYYFDAKDNTLSDQQIGLRHRLRYLDKELINELVQLKLPDSADGITRKEIKFEVASSSNVLDDLSRDPLLQYLSPADRDLLAFQLRKLGVDIKDIKEAVKLTQIRNRIYFNDTKGSVATITLDKCTQASFPFHGFTELEIEINEQRYTNATKQEIVYLENINENLKSNIQNVYPSLKIDQTPKYNKLMNQINKSLMSKINDHVMWFVYVCIVILAGFKLMTV